MTIDFSTDMPWVILRLQNQRFAVSTDCVREMVAMPKIVSLPQTPHYIRGVINLRDQVIPVIDLRMRLGITSSLNEVVDLIELLDQREQDHKDWLVELESSVKKRREFKLATDPHQCKFGIWYDNFKTDNSILASCLRKFDDPHKRIHAIADEVKKLEEKEDFDSAFSLIERTREGDLAKMINLFSEARSLLRETHREIALIIEWREKAMAAAVDSVETVEKLSESNIEKVPTIAYTMDNECVSGIGKREESDELIQILDVSSLIEQEEDLFSKVGNNN
ncbi:chemotaxis protein CheW [Thermodesulfobacteriota bacterium]